MRFRSAPGIILTRYGMRRFEFGKEFLHVSTFALLSLFEALANAFASVGEGGDVEEPLIRLDVLHNSGGLAFDRKHDRPFAFLKLFQKLLSRSMRLGEALQISLDNTRLARRHVTQLALPHPLFQPIHQAEKMIEGIHDE